jgi:hypothetical protein
MFDISTIPPIYIKPRVTDRFEIRDTGYEFELWVEGERWMNVAHKNNETIKQLYSHYDIAYGKVLITGLGFGISALWVASKPSVSHVTVVEKNPEVIEAFLASNQKPENMTIICEDANVFSTDEHFDCILSDHFENEYYQDILDSMHSLVERVPNHDVVWFWPLEHIYAIFTILQCGKWSEHVHYDAFRYFFYESDWLKYNPIVADEKWDIFKRLHLEKIKIANPKDEWFNTYYNNLGYQQVINR